MANHNPNQFDYDAIRGDVTIATSEDKRLDMLRQLIDAEQATEHAKARYKKLQAEFREIGEQVDRLYATQAELRRDLGIRLGFSDGSENCQATEPDPNPAIEALRHKLTGDAR